MLFGKDNGRNFDYILLSSERMWYICCNRSFSTTFLWMIMELALHFTYFWYRNKIDTYEQLKQEFSEKSDKKPGGTRKWSNKHHNCRSSREKDQQNQNQSCMKVNFFSSPYRGQGWWIAHRSSFYVISSQSTHHATS